MAQETDNQKTEISPEALSEREARERRRQVIARLKGFRKGQTLGMPIKDAINEGGMGGSSGFLSLIDKCSL